MRTYKFGFSAAAVGAGIATLQVLTAGRVKLARYALTNGNLVSSGIVSVSTNPVDVSMQNDTPPGQELCSICVHEGTDGLVSSPGGAANGTIPLDFPVGERQVLYVHLQAIRGTPAVSGAIFLDVA